MKRLFSIILNDLRNIQRDPFLLFIMLYPVLLAPLAKWMVPWLNEYYADVFDLSMYYPLILVFLGVVIPLVLGAAQAFIFLDDRDDRTILAIQVSPLPQEVYFASRFLLTIAGSILIIMIVIPYTELVSVDRFWLFLIALQASLTGPFMTLMIASLARNKVEGFALMKATGFFALIPVLAYFLPGMWNLFFAIIPGFWPAMAFYKLAGIDKDWFSIWFYLGAGTVYIVFVVWFFYQRFQKVIHRQG